MTYRDAQRMSLERLIATMTGPGVLMLEEIRLLKNEARRRLGGDLSDRDFGRLCDAINHLTAPAQKG